MHIRLGLVRPFKHDPDEHMLGIERRMVLMLRRNLSLDFFRITSKIALMCFQRKLGLGDVDFDVCSDFAMLVSLILETTVGGNWGCSESKYLVRQRTYGSRAV